MKSLTPAPRKYDDIFVGDSDMAKLMRDHDWSATPLGDPEFWPDALKVALRILLTSRFEMWLGWGPDIHFFYNDAYRPTLGDKHPRSLAMPTAELWAEIWEDIRDRLTAVYQEGAATWDRALMLLLDRNGYLEETYHTFSYSPLIGDNGRVEGVFCAVSEETERVVSERRLEALHQLSAGLAGAQSRDDVLRATDAALTCQLRDLPFSMVFLINEDGTPQLASAAGISRDHPLANVDLWQVDRARLQTLTRVEDVSSEGTPTGAWTQPPSRVAIVPIASESGGQPRGALVVGLNPHRPVNAQYLSFLELLAGRIAAGLFSAEIVEQRTGERDRIRLLMRQAPSFMCILSGPEHRFELVNDAYRTLVGHRDLVGLPLREALPEISGQGYFELLDGVYQTGEPFVGRNLEVMVQREAGAPAEQRFVNLVYQPIVEADGSVSGVFVDGFDTTDQKRAEDQLHQLNQTLEERVAEQTDELRRALEQLRHEVEERQIAEAALRQSQKLEALGKLTGGVAHDFNNLLQVIGGNLQLLMREVDDGGRAARRIRNAMAGVERGAKLASQLLAFGRRQPLEPKVVNLGRLVRGMDELLRRAIGEDIEIETIIAGGLWNASIDPGQIENAILNLAINARDAMPGGGRLTLEASNAFLDDEYSRHHDEVRAGQYVLIAVTDTGTGIPAEVMDQVFEPFFSTKPEGKGSGLGLSMVHGLVKQSGGHLKIYSEPGEGTTIKLYLPRTFEPEDAVIDAAASPIRGGTETVLVVEDDADVRETAVGLLADLGYRVLKAKDATSALNVIDSGLPIDLLFTDVVMPGPLRSPELARKAKERLPGIAVLFTSGYTENAIVHHGRLDPGVELLSKPYTREALARKVRAVLGEGKRATGEDKTDPSGTPLAEASSSAKCVLVVEDEALIRMTTVELLEEEGFTVLEANNAEAAEQVLSRARVDILLTDIGLPGKSGVDLAREALERLPNLSVIFVCGDDAHLRESGFASQPVLLKPYRDVELIQTVKRAAGTG